MNNQIILRISKEIKDDLKNTKAFDGKKEKKESFFQKYEPFTEKQDNLSEQEKEIQDFIQNYNSGACLVSGYRGIGKTSLINNCIEEYIKTEKEKSIIPININIPEADENGKLDKKEIINRMIIKLHENKDKEELKKVKNDIEKLYLKVFNNVSNIRSNKQEYNGTKVELNYKSIFLLIGLLLGGFLIGIIIGLLFISLGIFIFDLFNFKYLKSLNFEYLQKEFGIIIFGTFGSGILYKKWLITEEKKESIEELYNPDIAENKIKEIIEKLENTKFIFVIDELDKLLDFEKQIENRKNTKITITKVFEVLGKLKTLFFETNGAIFFVVTNKQAYDYYLQNKHQEDDLVSNIFNKIIYIPMNDKENFNLNYNIEISEKNSQKDSEKVNKLEITVKLKNYFYFKSHGNWRKAKFELSNMLKGNEIVLNKEEFDLEYKFYDFFDTLYKVFEKSALEKNLNDPFGKFIMGYKDLNDFLFGFNKGIFDKIYNYKTDINKLFYIEYLNIVKSIIIDKNIEKKDLFVINFIDKFINDFENGKFGKKEYFGYIIGSIKKLSEEYVYRDFVLSYLLNIFENIKFMRKTNLKEVFESIQINSDDLKYPAFTDLTLYWLPLFIFYFSNLEYHE